jgi:hypothetical protein
MLAVFLTALATQVAANLPFTMPAGLPDPLAYYWLNDHAPGSGVAGAPPGGAGMTVKESVSNVADAGFVDYDQIDQPQGIYPGVTWVDDPHFGNVFQCGNMDKDGLGEAKDILRLADVDYGSTGRFTLNFWVKNPPGTDFVNREKEQLFGHGDPYEISNAPNQIHLQVENLHVSDAHDDGPEQDPSGRRRAGISSHDYGSYGDVGGEVSVILADSNDVQSCLRATAGGAWTPEGTIPLSYLEGNMKTSADGKDVVMNNEWRQGVEINSTKNVDWQTRRRTRPVDVFPAMTCQDAFADFMAEGTASAGGNTVNMANMLLACVDGSGNEVTNEDDAMMCSRFTRGKTAYTRVFAEPGRTIMNRPGNIGVTKDGTDSGGDDGWHMLTITTNTDGTKGFAFYIDGVNRAALPMQPGVGNGDRGVRNYGYEGYPINGGDPIDPEGPFRFCGRETPGDWTGEHAVQFQDHRYSHVQLAHFSVYGEAMTGAQIEELRQAYVARFFPNAVEGYSSLPGTCRGPGGNDENKVNSKSKGGLTLEECKQECDSNAGLCKGFAYSTTECLIYGPGFAGSCSDASITSKDLCKSLGACADADKCVSSTGQVLLGKACQDRCGDCSDPTAESIQSCDTVDGTWTPLTWTAAAGSWTEPADGWTGDNHPDTSVATVRPDASGAYRCYDNDLYDHHPQCTGNVAVPSVLMSSWCTEDDVSNSVLGCSSPFSDFKCANSTCGATNCGDNCGAACDAVLAQVCTDPPLPGAGGWFGPCSNLFLGLSMKEKLPEICTSASEGAPENGCIFVPSITSSPVANTPHPKAEQYPGWKHMSGACRMDNPEGDGEVHVSGKYSQVAGCSPEFSCACAPRNGGDGCPPASQKQCKDHCEAEKGCLGYSHRDEISGYPYCILHGSGMNLTDDVWDADNRGFPTGPITTTKPNPLYICGVKSEAAKTKTEEQVSESCRPGAMLALALWLTRLWQ